MSSHLDNEIVETGCRIVFPPQVQSAGMSGNLLHQIARYCERTNTPETLFGRRCIGDSGLVAEMRRGRNPNVSTRQRVLAFIADNPKGVSPPPSQDPENLVVASQVSSKQMLADIVDGTKRLGEALQGLRPTNAPHRRPLSFEEKLALVAAGKVSIYRKPSLSPAYDYSLTGCSM